MMEYEQLQTDVLVIGAGAAGCRAALEAHDYGARVLLVAKGRLGHSGSTFYPGAMGVGYTSALPDEGEGTAGSGPEIHYREIMAAGLGMASPTLARILAEEAPLRLLDLISCYRLAFRRQDGQILFLQPDFGSGVVRAGAAPIGAIREAFCREIRARGIPVLERTAAVRLLGDRNGCTGAIGVTRSGEVIAMTAKATVLATGGGSTAFLRHMNTPDLAFDGHGMALELGAQLVNMEFYQMILGLTAPVKRLLIPESYLALQPRLTNGLGEEFLGRYLPPGVTLAECLNTRAGTGPFRSDAAAMYFDVAVFDEVRQGRGTRSGGVQADFTACDPEQVRATGRLGWYEWASARGADLLARPVDISPHVHAINGGVLINPEGETSVPNLFACGEAAGGPHGANRIGGNQFAGSQVFGARAGRYAAGRAAALPLPRPALDAAAQVREQVAGLRRRSGGRSPDDILIAIQTAMWNEMGVHKDAASLRRCREALESLAGDLEEMYAPDPRRLFLALSLPHLWTTARAIVGAATMREESRGPHYRTDFPHRDDVRMGQPILIERGAEGPVHRFGSLSPSEQGPTGAADSL